MTSLTPPKPAAQRLSVGLRKILPRQASPAPSQAPTPPTPLPLAGEGRVKRSDTQGEGNAPTSPASQTQATPLPLAGEGRVERSDTQGEGIGSKSPSQKGQPPPPRPLPTRLPKKPTADLLRIGWLLVDSGQPTAALAIFAEAIAADDRSAIAWAAYGLALAKAGEHTKAQDALFKAAMRAPKDIEVSCALGEAALLRGDFAAAHKALATCCTLDPTMETPCGLRARALLRKAQKQLSDS